MFIAFANPLNFGRGRNSEKAVGSTNLNQSTNQRTFTCHIDETGDGTGTARTFTHIAVISSGTASYTVSGAQTIPARTITPTYTNSFNETISRDFDGLRYDLYAVPKAPMDKLQSGQSLVFTFTGSGRIHQVAVLSEVFRMAEGGFSVSDFDNIQVGATRETADRETVFVPALNNQSDKWQIRLRADLYSEKHPPELAETILSFVRSHKHCYVAVDTEVHPYFTFAATFPNAASQMRYIGRNKSGRYVSFTVRER